MSNITLTIPNDDHIALRAFGKALEEMALAHGAEPRKTTIDTSEATAAVERLCAATEEPEIDTTAQQVESLAAPMGDDEEQAPSTTDSTGTPWDERIHSASKALNSDGTWRLRRKPKDMDETEWAKYVEAVKTNTTDVNDDSWDTDRRPGSGGNGGVGVGESDDFEPPVTPPGDDFHTDAGAVTEQTVAGIPPIPVPPPVTTATLEMNLPTPPHAIPVTAQVVDDWTFPKLMTFLTERQGKIDVATVNMLLAQDGMSSVQELNAHPDKIGPFVARVKAHLGE